MSRVFAGSLFLLFASSSLQAGVILNEGFDNISTLAGSGWAMVNNSAPVGTTGWFQGNTAVFGSQAGAPDSYNGDLTHEVTPPFDLTFMLLKDIGWN